MTDDKPMSAEEVAADVIGKMPDKAFDKFTVDEAQKTRDLIATALRDHAAEAVEAERETCAQFVEQQVEVRAPHDRAINSDRAFLGDAIRQGKHADE